MPWVREESFETGFACQGAVVMARVTRDGALELDGYDLQYEQAYMEFYGGEPSACMDMYRSWDSSPANVILKYFNILYYDLPRLALDWAEHVAWMVRAGAVPPKRNRIRRVFDEARELVNIREECYALYGNAMGVIPRKPADRIVELESNLKYINTYFNNDPNFRASSKAIEAIHSGLNAALLASQYRSDSTNGRFFVIESGKDSAKFAIQAFKARNQGSAQREQTWQVRRFIDVMSAKKHKQPWPPLKWTK